MGVKLVSASAGSVELVAPVTASNYTATMPAKTGTVAMDGPAFSVYLAGTQSITNATATKIQLTVERFDTASAFDNVTNYRFQPLVAGYYQISGSVGYNTATNNVGSYAILYKNGSSIAQASSVSTSASYMIACVSSLIYLNGSSDYVELYAQQQTGGTATAISGALITGDATQMTGSMVRGA